MNKHCFPRNRYYLVVILFFLSVLTGFGQSLYNTTTWKFSNPTPFGTTTLDLDFVNDHTALAVGSDGSIARTTDGGATWTHGVFSFVRNSGNWTKPSFSDVHFVTTSTAYAVGPTGCMVKSTDGGVSWNLLQTPFYSTERNINTVWFVNENTGYIGGQWNSIDSIPKLYFTNNGGATWDSLDAPIGGKTRVGYINNPNIPSEIWDVSAKGKEIWRIEFSGPTTGYITGGGSSLFPRVSANANSSTCLPSTGNLTTSANNAALVWKYSNGVLTDYSLSKERLGYSGINTNTVTCTSSYNAAQITPVPQQYRAINIINDSLLLIMSFNNNCVIRIHTGRNDSTSNLATGLNEGGRYEIMNYPFPPTQGPQAGTPIPSPQVLVASNPYHIKKAANGTLYATGNFARLWTSVDTGRNWIQQNSLPAGQNYSAFGTWALDITPSGRFVAMGTNGVISDSSAGTTWQSNYNLQVAGGYGKLEFADCNNGLATGGASIAVTNDGGRTWFDRTRSDFVSLNISINSHAYVPGNPARAYFVTSVGNIYRSDDINAVPPVSPTLDPVFFSSTDQMWDVATVGNDSVWVVGHSSFSVPAASRSPKVFRSVDGGNNWTIYNSFHMGSTFQNLRFIEFPTHLVGYAAGSRDTIWKTTDGGVTWNKLPLPTPGITPQITYTDMFALNENVVFLTGNGFPRKVVFRTQDGGATWDDITNNILAFGFGNLNTVLFHDINNGYVTSPGGVLFKTHDGGATWTHDLAPTSSLFNSIAFAPKTVSPTVPFSNRKVFISGFTLPNVAGHIMEYGNPADINVNTTEVITNADCSNPNGGSITVSTSGGIAPYTYSINGGAFQSSNTFTGLAAGTYTVVVNDTYCGTLAKTLTVGFNDNLAITASNDTTVCAGAPVPLLAGSNLTGTGFSWSPAGGLSATNIANPVATVNNPVTYTVTATLNGCSRTETVSISIKPNPVVNAGPDKTIVDGDATTLQGSSANTPQSVNWTPAATLTGSTTFTPVAKPNTTTTYTLTVLDQNGCTSTDDVTVTVIPYCVNPMNAFTPNGDGMNDRWQVTNGAPCTDQVKVAVYNRYGNTIYTNNNYMNNWDGTYNGKPVTDGTYYYIVTYRLINGNVVTLKGDVTILR